MTRGAHTKDSELRYPDSLEEDLPKGLAWDDFRIFLAVVRRAA